MTHTKGNANTCEGSLICKSSNWGCPKRKERNCADCLGKGCIQQEYASTHAKQQCTWELIELWN